MKKVYKIKRICYDANLNVSPYEDNPEKEFDSYDEAWNFIEQLADEEVEVLNEGCEEGISFGIVEDEEYARKEKCKIDYYYLEDEFDDAGNTELVIQYSVYEVDDMNMIFAE